MITIKDIMEEAEKKGSHFFKQSSMNFFHSEIYEDVFKTKNPNIFLFLTSEKRCFEDVVRVFNIRRFNRETGNISTVRDFGLYTKKMHAVRDAELIAENPADV